MGLSVDLKKKAQPESCELSFIGGNMSTAALGTVLRATLQMGTLRLRPRLDSSVVTQLVRVSAGL